jgi:CHAT domain-containing protein/tetratricopeptide (TPR) repeat protein
MKSSLLMLLIVCLVMMYVHHPAAEWNSLLDSGVRTVLGKSAVDTESKNRTINEDSLATLLGIASTRLTEGDFTSARLLFSECREAIGNIGDPAYPMRVEAVIGLSNCLCLLNDFVSAAKVLRSDIEAISSRNGEQNAAAGYLTLHLAEALSMLDQHVESTMMFRRAASIIENSFGDSHTRTAEALAGLAHTFRRAGRQAEAEVLYRRSIQIIAANHGRPHPLAIRILSKLGRCLDELDRREEALLSIEAGVAEATEIYGEGSYQQALAERHLGHALIVRKEWQRAISVFEKSLAVLTHYLGAEHPYLSICYKGIAKAYKELGNLQSAIDFAERAVSTYEHPSGSDPVELVHLLYFKAHCEMDAQQWPNAVATLCRAIQTHLMVQEESYRLFSIREAVTFSNMPWAMTRQLVAALDADPSPGDSSLVRSFAMVMRTHGHVLDWLCERQQRLESVPDTCRIEQLHNSYVTATQYAVNLMMEGSAGHNEDYAERLAGARKRQEELDRRLSAAIEQVRSDMGVLAPSKTVSTGSIAAAMDAGATMIHFVRFPKWMHATHEGKHARRSHYGAFRLRKSKDDGWTLDFIELAPAASVHALIGEYRRSIDQTPPGRKPSPREEAEFRAAARSMYDMLWAPLFGRVREGAGEQDTSQSTPLVFIVADSRLYQIDFNTLLSPSGQLVIEMHRLHHLSSARDLLRFTADHVREIGSGLLAVGNPHSPFNRSVPARESTDNERHHQLMDLCADFLKRLPELPSAEKEVREVSELFTSETKETVMVLIGTDATEAAVKRLCTSPRILHLAAHGFFCEERTRSGQPLVERLDDPLLRTGLLLTPDAYKDDGILTAQEVACLELSHLDWVVLSACGTALGRIIGGEGVFGLRRVFELAGARTVVMSMWKIDDRLARDLMPLIYRYRLSGSSTVDAVRSAQLDLLLEQRKQNNRIHPALWGGIIAEGDWR